MDQSQAIIPPVPPVFLVKEWREEWGKEQGVGGGGDREGIGGASSMEGEMEEGW